MKDTTQIQQLKEKVFALQNTIDSLKQSSSIRQFEYELHQKQDIITQVNEFYDTAWVKLIVVISILGILLPIIAQYLQRQNLKDLTEFIRKQLNDNFDYKIQELKEFNKTEIDKTTLELSKLIEAFESQNKKNNSQIEATLYFLQGRSSISTKEYADAVRDFAKSAYYWGETDKIERIPIMLNNLRSSLTKLPDKKSYELANQLLKNGMDMNLKEIIEHLNNHENYTFFEESLNLIKKEIERLEALPNE